MGKRWTIVLAASGGAALASGTGHAQTNAAPSLAPLIEEVVHILAKPPADGGRAGGGYDIGRRFTRDLRYGDAGTLLATRPVSGAAPYKTMCVAGVTEVIVEALNLWGRRHDRSYATTLPIARWTGGTRTSVIANIFMYRGSNSRGTAHALERLGLGAQKPFQRLRPGDVINFNRSGGTGHAVIFMGYLAGQQATPVPAFSARVTGFRYFSAQGKGRADGGFGYRNAYFVGKCPVPRGRDDDCNIIGLRIAADGTVSQNPIYFVSGEMWAPPAWRVDAALAALRSDTMRGFDSSPVYRDGASRAAAADAVLRQQLEPDPTLFEDGSDEE